MCNTTSGKDEHDVRDLRFIRKVAWHPYHPSIVIAGKNDGTSEIVVCPSLLPNHLL